MEIQSTYKETFLNIQTVLQLQLAWYVVEHAFLDVNSITAIIALYKFSLIWRDIKRVQGMLEKKTEIVHSIFRFLIITDILHLKFYHWFAKYDPLL